MKANDIEEPFAEEHATDVRRRTGDAWPSGSLLACLPSTWPAGWHSTRASDAGSLELRSDQGQQLTLRVLEGGGVAYFRASLRTPGRRPTDEDVRRVVADFFVGRTPRIVWYPASQEGGAVHLYRRIGGARDSEPPRR